MPDATTIRAAYQQHYGATPQYIARAPGRVNLIGEHTDYNDGFVFPVAIDRAAFVAASPRSDQTVRVYAAQFDQDDTFTLGAFESSDDRPWSNYVRGMVAALRERGVALVGADLLIDGDVPLGSGLSSSAALEIAVGTAFQLMNDFNISGEDLARLAQHAENDFVGVQCGIMDQFISALGQADHALRIDCRDLSYRPVPLPADVRVIVCDSNVSHAHGSSGYNERRAECEQAVEVLQQQLPQITALRDVTLADLEQHGHLLSPVVLRRARHVVSENQRVRDGVAALQDGDLQRFGTLMNASHQSMRDDYAISTPEIDLLTELARQVPGCYGSRLTGGGFGGSTVSLVAVDAVDQFVAAVGPAYRKQTGRDTTIYVCQVGAGAGQVK